MGMDEIVIKVSSLTGVSMSDILSGKRTQDICYARRIFIYLSCRIFGESHANIALFLRRTRQNVSDQMQLFDQEMRIYRGLKSKVDEIAKEILSEN